MANTRNICETDGCETRCNSGRTMCSACRHKVEARAKYWANRDQVRAQQRAAYQANKDRVKAQAREYRKSFPEKAKAAVLRWVENNRERLRAVKRAYAKARPELGRNTQARRRARVVGTTVGPIKYSEIRRASGGKCGICGDAIAGAYHYDHIVPLAAGGTHTQDNIQVAHPRCNVLKGAKVA